MSPGALFLYKMLRCRKWKSPMQLRYDLKISWLCFRCDDAMSNQKINDHNSTIWFERSTTQRFEYLVHIPESKVLNI